MNFSNYEDIKIGEIIDGFSIEITREIIQNFAEASLDFNPLHWDDRFMKETSFGKTKFKGIISHGMLTFSLITRIMTDWLLPRGGIHRRLETNWINPIYPGDRITIQGKVFDKKKTRKSQWVLIKIEVKNQEKQVVGTGEAMAEFPIFKE